MKNTSKILALVLVVMTVLMGLSAFTASAAGEVYTVAGEAGLCGNAWDTGYKANDMTYDSATGTYTKVFENVAAGTYQYKVVKNHAWGTGEFPTSGNYTVTVPESGSTVTVKWNPSTKTLEAEVSKGGEVVKPDTTPIRVYVDNAKGWSKINVYYWGGANQPSWPGNAMQYDSELKLWYYDIPVGHTMCIFNNGSAQTADLAIPKDDAVVFNNSSNAWGTLEGEIVYPTFTIAGTGAHLGTEWDTKNTKNDMTYDPETGVYTKVYENVAKGTYKFKCAQDHEWTVAYPAQDKSYTVAESGSTVTITLKDTAVTVTVTPPPHTHSWSDATCTEPQKCECGETQGEALGHNFENCACTRCKLALPTLGDARFDFSTEEGYNVAAADEKLGLFGTFRNNGGSYQFAETSSIQFVAPANANVTIKGHSAQYGVFDIYLDGVLTALENNGGVYTFSTTAETRVMIVPNPEQTYKYAYIVSINIAIDRTITEDTTISFGSNGNYKDSGIDFSGIVVNDNGGDNAQVKEGSFSMKLKAGASVVIGGYPGYTSYKLSDGKTETAEITDEFYTYIATEDVTLTYIPVNGGSNYLKTIAITFHTNLTKVEAKAPTCLEGGHGEYYACDCHGALTDKGEVPAAGHTNVYGICQVCYLPQYYIGDNKLVAVEGLPNAQDGSTYEFFFFFIYEAGHYEFVGDNILVTIFTDPVVDGKFDNTKVRFNSAWLEPGMYSIGVNYYAGAGEYKMNVAKCECTFVDATCTAAKYCSGCFRTEGEALGHDMQEATCTAPKSCSRCDVTEGEALGHDWKDATCTEAKKCERCQETEGEALGHDWKDATCTEAKKCGRCGETEGEALGHDYKDGSCTRCGAADPDHVPDPEPKPEPAPELTLWEKIMSFVQDLIARYLDFLKGLFGKFRK